MQIQSPSKLSLVSTALFHTDMTNYASKHGGSYKTDYIVLKERPIGPHKKLAPGVKQDGRIGPQENYRYIVHYPKVLV